MMEAVDHISGRGIANEYDDRVNISLDDTPLASSFKSANEPGQRFQLIDLLFEQTEVSQKELSETVTSVSVSLDFLSGKDADDQAVAAREERPRPEASDPYGLLTPFPSAIKLKKPAKAKTGRIVWTRLKTHFKDKVKLNTKGWEKSFRLNEWVFKEEETRMLRITLPPGGVVFSDNPLIFDLMGIPRNLLQRPVPGVVMLHNESDTEPKDFDGLQIPVDYFSKLPIHLLNYVMTIGQNFTDEELEGVIVPEWQVAEDLPVLQFAMASGQQTAVYDGTPLPPGHRGVNTLITAQETILPVLRKYFSSRGLPPDLLILTSGTGGSLRFTKNEKYGMVGAIRLVVTLENAPEKLNDSGIFGDPFKLMNPEWGTETDGIIGLGPDATDIETERRFTTGNPFSPGYTMQEVAGQLGRPSSAYYIVLLNADPNLNRVSKVLQHLYTVIGYLDSSSKIHRSKPFQLPPLQTRLDLGLFSIGTRELYKFEKTTKVTLCLQSVA